MKDKKTTKYKPQKLDEKTIKDVSPGSFSVIDAIGLAESDDDRLLKSMHIDLPPEPDEPKAFLNKDKAKVGGKKAPDKYKVNVVDPTKEVKIPVKAEMDLNEQVVLTPEAKQLYEDPTEPIKITPKEKKRNIEQEKLDAMFDNAKPESIAESKLIEAAAYSDEYVRAMTRADRRKKVTLLIIAIILALFLIMFSVAAVLQFSNSFTITLDKSDLQKGLTLYDNAAKENPTSRLMTSDIPDCDNITFGDIQDKLFSTRDNTGIDNIDGNHSTKNYFAYTFYVSNEGGGIIDYELNVNIVQTAKGMDDVMRILIISDSTYYNASDNIRKPQVFAKPKSDVLSGEWFTDSTGKYVMQDLLDHNGSPMPIQDNAQPFHSKTVAYKREVKQLFNSAPLNMHKYTIIVYIEGGDPECVNDLKGGGIRFSVSLKVTDYKTNIKN